MFGFWKQEKETEMRETHFSPPPFDINRKMLRVFVEGKQSVTCKTLDELFDEIEKWTEDYEVGAENLPLKIEVVTVNETFFGKRAF